jgi:hypothetical protein
MDQVSKTRDGEKTPNYCNLRFISTLKRSLKSKSPTKETISEEAVKVVGLTKLYVKIRV